MGARQLSGPPSYIKTLPRDSPTWSFSSLLPSRRVTCCRLYGAPGPDRASHGLGRPETLGKGGAVASNLVRGQGSEEA